jgi:hypothetical protein
VAATSGGAFATGKKVQAQLAQQSNNFNTSKSNSAGIIIATTTSNGAGQKKVGAGSTTRTSKSIDSRFGGASKDLKTVKPGGGPRDPQATNYHASKSNTSNLAVTGSKPVDAVRREPPRGGAAVVRPSGDRPGVRVGTVPGMMPMPQ